MKYNKIEIMKKMHRLVKIYGINMSEALRKSWSMAKLEIAENELFLRNMKDINGGASNIIAQNQIEQTTKQSQSSTTK